MHFGFSIYHDFACFNYHLAALSTSIVLCSLLHTLFIISLFPPLFSILTWHFMPVQSKLCFSSSPSSWQPASAFCLYELGLSKHLM